MDVASVLGHNYLGLSKTRIFRMQNEVGTPENEIGFACKEHVAIKNIERWRTRSAPKNSMGMENKVGTPH